MLVDMRDDTVVADRANRTTNSPVQPHPDRGPAAGVEPRVRTAFWVASALVVAFLVSLVVRETGSYYLPVDGWGVDLFELSMGALCVLRYFDRSWRAESTTSVLPLVLGAACIAWALGDIALTVESFGGRDASHTVGRRRVLRALLPLLFRRLHAADPSGDRQIADSRRHSMA